MKEIKKIIFKLGGVVEDSQTTLIKKSNDVAYSDVIEGLKYLKDDKNIEEILIDLDNINLSDSHIEEIKVYFDEMKKNKKIKAIASNLDIKNYKVALFAKEILLFNTKQSNLSFRAYSFQSFYLEKFLRKIGIKMNVLHVGEHKVAGENFHLNKMSEERKSSLKNIGDSITEDFINLVRKERNVDIKSMLEKGDLIFKNYIESKELGLIDGVFEYEEIEKNFDERKDTINFLEYLNKYKKVKNKAKDQIAIIYLEGIIQESSNLSSNYISYQKVKEKIKVLEEIKNLKGLVLRINSPGGSAIESEKIYQKLKTLSVPIYVSMGDYCASGGYYIASVGKKLYANKNTLTGSIGVVMMYPELSDVLKKNEVNLEEVSYGNQKFEEEIEDSKGSDIFNIYKKLTEESKNKILKTMQDTYIEFKEHVMKARNMEDKDLEKIAGGRVWLGKEAKDILLVDELGSLENCIEDFSKDLELVKYKVEHIYLNTSFKEQAKNMIPKLSYIKGLVEKRELEEIEFFLENKNKIIFYEKN